MEADLHAIIRSGQPLTDQHFQSFIYQTLCGLLVSEAVSILLLAHYVAVYPLGQRVASRSQTWKSARQRRLRIEDLRFRSGERLRSRPASNECRLHDRIRSNTVVQGSGNHAQLYKLYHSDRSVERRMHFGRAARRKTDIQGQRVGLTFFPDILMLTVAVFLSYVDQLNQILHFLGTPSEDTLRRVGSPRVCEIPCRQSSC